MSDAQPTQPTQSAQPPQSAGPAGTGVTVPEIPARRADSSTGWIGWVIFAGVVMLVMGLFHVIEGLTALFNPGYFVVGQNGLAVSVDFTAWGWAHLVLGVIIFFAGAAVMAGRTWGRMVGITLAVLSAIVNIGFLAAFPLWSLIIIALDIVVIYALAVHGREAKA
ncbi:MAG: DUF7144 family membrane protein [Streptosporangiaceae bacterium]